MWRNILAIPTNQCSSKNVIFGSKRIVLANIATSGFKNFQARRYSQVTILGRTTFNTVSKALIQEMFCLKIQDCCNITNLGHL